MAGRAPSLPARYLLRVQYDGTNFHGFQRQAKARTVQGCVEDALSRFVGGEKKKEKGDDVLATDATDDDARRSGVLTHGSSRTDAGVHALDATMHVDLTRVSRRTPNLTPKPFEARAVMSATNHFLRRAGANDARVWACARVCPEKFHARYSATARTYVYRLRVSPAHRPPSVFEKGKVWHVVRDEPLDVDAMREAARLLVGARDFSSFRARGCQAKSAARTVDALDVEVDDALANAFDPEHRAWFGERDTDFSGLPEEVLEREETNREETNGGGGSGHGHPAGTSEHRVSALKKKKNFVSCVAVTARAPSFLYHQVRLMVATLVAVGAGDMTPADVQELLAKKDVSFAPPMAPACGLYLARVHYDGSRKWDARRGAASDG